MPSLNSTTRTIRVKIVYYGAGLSGKTTNLDHLHRVFPKRSRGVMVKLDTETERTLFFDYFPATLGKLGGYGVKVDFFTVPGQSFYNATRRAVLEKADGIAFVADSSPRREHANRVALENLAQNLATWGRKLEDIPLVFQWNKRDVPNALPVSLLERTLNPRICPSVAAIAKNGEGVWDTQAAILRAVLDHLRRQYANPRRRYA
ncbi:MAG: GTPase domain-containing protein [Myxococcota bacterium]